MSFGNAFLPSDRGWARRCGWIVVAALLLGGCGKEPKKAEVPPVPTTQQPPPGAVTLEQNKKYAVYYYDQANKVVLVESLSSPPQGRTITAPAGSVPALAETCDPSLPSKPSNCQGNSCPVGAMAASAVYYGEGSQAENAVKVIGVEKGPFTNRTVEWDGGAGCSPACPKRCCAPVTGGCRCMC